MTSKKSLSQLWRDVLTGAQSKKSISNVDVLPIKTALRSVHLRAQVLQVQEQEIAMTSREWDTARAIVRGGTLKEVALQLGLSHRTVEFYVKNIRHKLGCRNKKSLREALLKLNILGV